MQENGNENGEHGALPLSHDGARPSGAEKALPESPAELQQVVLAEAVEPAPPKPRIWTALCVGILTLPVAMLIGGSVVAFAAITDRGMEVLREGVFPRWCEEYSQTRLGLVMLVLPGQAVFLFAAWGAAVLSPQPVSRRLGLRRGVLPLWTWAVFVLATPVIAILSSLILSWFVDELSDSLKMMEQMMQAHAHGFLLGLILIVAVVPGVVEELMFRGYVQTRLAERWHPGLAILISAVLFSAAHLDPVHMLGVIPLGLWLGAIAWRADSVLPAMLCHAANNVIAVAGAKYEQIQTLGMTLDPITTVALAISLPAFLFSLYIFRSN